jgi:hypothetical protein
MQCVQNTKIPLQCFQGCRKIENINQKLKASLKISRDNNPRVTFHLYDAEAMHEYMEKNAPNDLFRAYKNIHDGYGAAKADVFRYFILYREGGMWLDLKSVLLVDVTTILRADDVAILDVPNYYEEYRKVYSYHCHEQWFLAFAKGHPYLHHVLKRITRDLSPDNEECDYVKSLPTNSHATTFSKQMTLRMTGPDALAVAIHDSIIKYGAMHRTVPYRIFLKYSTHNHISKSHYSFQKNPIRINHETDCLKSFEFEGKSKKRTMFMGDHCNENLSNPPDEVIESLMCSFLRMTLHIVLFSVMLCLCFTLLLSDVG